jgi:hypothetical protein
LRASTVLVALGGGKDFSPKTFQKVSPSLKAPKLVKHAKRFLPRLTNVGAFSGGETFLRVFREKYFPPPSATSTVR